MPIDFITRTTCHKRKYNYARLNKAKTLIPQTREKKRSNPQARGVSLINITYPYKLYVNI